MFIVTFEKLKEFINAKFNFMKKFLLSIAAVFLTMGAMAQNEIRLTFSRTGTDAGSVTVNVVDENGNAIVK